MKSSEFGKLDSALRSLDGEITPGEIMDIFLVAVAEKPGGLVMRPGDSYRALEEVLEELGLDYREMGGAHSGLMHRLLDDPGDSGIFYTASGNGFTQLEESEGEFYGCSTEAVGSFLGYPDKAIQHYKESEIPGKETVEQVKENHGEKQLEFLGMISYIPSPDESSVDEAIEIGRKRSEFIERNSEQLEFIDQLRRKLSESSIWSGR